MTETRGQPGLGQARARVPAGSSDLAALLFRAPARWGWEYREPQAPRRSPGRDREPLWVEPAAPRAAIHVRSNALPKRAAIVTAILIAGLVLRKDGILLDGLALVLAAIFFAPAIIGAVNSYRRRLAFVAQRNQEYARYEEAWAQWRVSVESWDAGERARIAMADLWYPMEFPSSVWRTDVFGGTADGWAALLTTFGASELAADRSLLILDLSEQNVCADLAAMAALQRLSVRKLELPREFGKVDMLHNLDSDGVSEIIAEAVHTIRETGSADLRILDAALIRAVTDRLDGNLTLRKILGGLQVLLRSYDGTQRSDAALSGSELGRLAMHVDIAGQDDQTQRELRFLAGCVALLTSEEDAAVEPSHSFWQPGIFVLQTTDTNARRKDLADRVLVQTLLHHLRLRAGGATNGTLLIVGCDHLGLRTLETVARLARQAGMRIVLMLEHLRGDLAQLLGGSDSASIIMRLGNAGEAAAAAEHIGRGYRFILNQVSRQMSDADTQGESAQWGATDTASDNHSAGGGRSSGGGSSHWSRSVGSSRADTWARTVNWSSTMTATDGATASRVYEFAVEPTQIQSMPTTAFVSVDTASGRRRVVAGDCNPGISLLDRVAAAAEPGAGAPAPFSVPDARQPAVSPAQSRGQGARSGRP